MLATLQVQTRVELCPVRLVARSGKYRYTHQLNELYHCKQWPVLQYIMHR